MNYQTNGKQLLGTSIVVVLTSLRHHLLSSASSSALLLAMLLLCSFGRCPACQLRAKDHPIDKTSAALGTTLMHWQVRGCSSGVGTNEVLWLLPGSY